MPKIKDKKNANDNNDVVVSRSRESGLAEFIQRPMPTDEEVENFEEFIEESAYAGATRERNHDKRGVISLREEEASGLDRELDEEIDESLHEIYQDNNGKMVDVKKMDIKKRHGFFFWIAFFIFISGALAGAAYGAYNYFYLGSGSDATAVEFSIEGNSETAVGEEFFYSLVYKNASNIGIRSAKVEAKFPENFIFLDSYPVNSGKGDKMGLWEIGSLGARQTGKVRVKGMMIGAEDSIGVIQADIIYSPENFSSEFKKEATLSTVINNIGFDVDFDYVASALIGQEDEITIRFNPRPHNYVGDFRVIMEPQENIEVKTAKVEEKNKENLAVNKEIRPGVWEISALTEGEKILPLSVKFTEKKADQQSIKVYFEKIVKESPAVATTTTEAASSRYIRFYEKTLDFEVMKSDLNLTLIINGSREDQGADFSQTLNYSIVYNNKGETGMKDVVIMAVLESDFLDWTSLQDENKGREKGNTITWSKEEIPALALLAQHAEGTIDFSIDLMAIGNVDPDKKYQVLSYAQFSVGEIEESDEKPAAADSRSNTILIKINSDLDLKESVRYFNEENIPVGTGPHPPKVGEATSYKVYWNLTNNLHELSGLKVSVKLPEYVNWDGKERATAGTVRYSGETREVVWDIGRLPITVYESSAEFSIAITPKPEDKNTIMVLLPGSSVTATDSETGAELTALSKAKTTKLEDDEIANGAGVVE